MYRIKLLNTSWIELSYIISYFLKRHFLDLLFILLCIMLALSPYGLSAQGISDVHARFDDSIEEWELFDYDDEDLPSVLIRLNGIADRDLHLWDVDLGDMTGQISKKWKDQNDLWEFRVNGEIITARVKWKNDYSEWEIKDGQNTYVLKTQAFSRNSDWTFGQFKDVYWTIAPIRAHDFRDIELFYEFDEAQKLVYLQIFSSFLVCFLESNL